MMIFVFPVLFFGWKLIKRTKWIRADEFDLYQDFDGIEKYTRNFVETPPKNGVDKWFNKIFS
jgi:amino acid transporter